MQKVTKLEIQRISEELEKLETRAHKTLTEESTMHDKAQHRFILEALVQLGNWLTEHRDY